MSSKLNSKSNAILKPLQSVFDIYKMVFPLCKPGVVLVIGLPHSTRQIRPLVCIVFLHFSYMSVELNKGWTRLILTLNLVAPYRIYTDPFCFNNNLCLSVSSQIVNIYQELTTFEGRSANSTFWATAEKNNLEASLW